MNGRQLARLVDAIGSPAVRALWDPGNDLYAPLPERPYPEGYEAIRGWIAHVHLKDARLLNGQAEGCCFGEGEMDWEGQLRALKRDGYQGWLVMETHYRLAAVLSFTTSLMPTTGSMPGIKAFTAAVFGGIGSIPGAFLGGILLGVIESLAKAYISTQLANAILFAVLIIVLLVKPSGLLGKYVPEKV